MERVLITGGNGFIGSNLTKRLIDEGCDVTITSSGTNPQFKIKTLYTSLDGIDWKYVARQDVVFHQMANNNTRCLDEEEMWRTNVFGPMKLFVAALEGGCRRFVYASSTAVYGNSPAPYVEDTTLDPLNPYAESKAEFDKFAMRFAETHNVPVIGLRYCNVYGPGEDHKGKMMSMVGQMMNSMISGDNVTLFKDGTQKRDWVYVKDVVDANILAMKSDKTGIYNIGGGGSWSFKEVFDTIKAELVKRSEFLASSINYIDCPFQESYQSHTECCIEKATNELGYSPKYNLALGVKEYIETKRGSAS